MARSQGPSLRWLTLAVLLPLLVLAGLAWMGTRSQLKAAWTDAREEAVRRAEEHADKMTAALGEATITAPTYPDPPVPGSPSEKDIILDGSDIPALLALRDDPGAGLSPAGLPRRVLAALRVRQLDPAAQAAEEIIALTSTAAPSVLTGRALHLAGASEQQLRDWNQAEEARQLLRQHPESASDGFWCSTENNFWWIEDSGDSIRFLKMPKVTLPPPGRRSGVSLTPAWLRLVSPRLNQMMWDEELEHSGEKLLAEVPIDFASDLRVLAYADPVILEQGIRRQQKWTLALLSAAVLVSAVSLLAIHRSVARERRLGELKSQFVSSVSHELRAPVGSIRLMAEALQAGKVAKPGNFHSLIAREGERLSHLIENVLDFARIEEGRKRYHFEESDLVALLRDAIAPMEPPAAEKGVTIATELADCTASVDPAAIQQALVNLLDNAIKFSPKGSEVRVTLESTETDWQLSVADHGPGIPASEHRRIFERFHRLGDELRRETQGTGIGLSIVQHITEAHHGEIRLTSRPGKGSTFTLRFPRSEP